MSLPHLERYFIAPPLCIFSLTGWVHQTIHRHVEAAAVLADPPDGGQRERGRGSVAPDPAGGVLEGYTTWGRAVRVPRPFTFCIGRAHNIVGKATGAM